MNLIARSLVLTLAVSMGMFAWGCDAGPTESEEQADLEDEADEEMDLEADEPEAEEQVLGRCFPAKMPVCGPATTMVCEGTGTCRRCICSEF